MPYEPLPPFKFIGMNNVDDPSDLDIGKGECVNLTNVDPDDKGGFGSRDGFTSALVGAAHSGWSHNGIAYVVKGGYLCSFNGTATVNLHPVAASLPMAYVAVNDIVVASNGVQYLIIENGVVSTATPSTEPFKITPPAGQYLAFYNGRLYIASGNSLYVTDPFTVDTCDARQMAIPITQDRITGIASVDDGLFIGTAAETFFMGGDDPFAGGMSLRGVSADGVVDRTMKATRGERMPFLQLQGDIAVWVSARGEFVAGGGGGHIRNISAEVCSLPVSETGASFIREMNGQNHFIAVLGNGTEFNPYIPPVLDMDEVEL